MQKFISLLIITSFLLSNTALPSFAEGKNTFLEAPPLLLNVLNEDSTLNTETFKPVFTAELMLMNIEEEDSGEDDSTGDDSTGDDSSGDDSTGDESTGDEMSSDETVTETEDDTSNNPSLEKFAKTKLVFKIKGKVRSLIQVKSIKFNPQDITVLEESGDSITVSFSGPELSFKPRAYRLFIAGTIPDTDDDEDMDDDDTVSAIKLLEDGDESSSGDSDETSSEDNDITDTEEDHSSDDETVNDTENENQSIAFSYQLRAIGKERKDFNQIKGDGLIYSGLVDAESVEASKKISGKGKDKGPKDKSNESDKGPKKDKPKKGKNDSEDNSDSGSGEASENSGPGNSGQNNNSSNGGGKGNGK